MSFNKEQVVEYVLNLISNNDKRIVPKTTKYFGISKSSVYNYLAELVDNGTIKKDKGGYSLVFKKYSFKYDNTDRLGEDRVFTQDILPLICTLPDNVRSIWNYAFTEMMNNAIEHSSADKILVSVMTNEFKTSILIYDNGIGIFKNIQSFIKEQRGESLPLDECASLLFAGKFTTAENMHSGEGIFFTSHVMDTFVILSDDVVFSRNNFKDNWAGGFTPKQDGTVVIMELYNHTKKVLRDVFSRFASIEDGFTKTSIPIAHFFSGGYPVSRSEARRLGEIIMKFEEIDLDFLDVEDVGQAFVHELFVVWQGKNPNKRLNVLNTSEGVNFMIKRVLNTK